MLRKHDVIDDPSIMHTWILHQNSFKTRVLNDLQIFAVSLVLILFIKSKNLINLHILDGVKPIIHVVSTKYIKSNQHNQSNLILVTKSFLIDDIAALYN